MSDEHEMTTIEPKSARTWTEAPASATVKAKYRSREWMITLRGETGAEVIHKIDQVSDWLDKHAEAVNVEPTPADVKATNPAPAPAAQQKQPSAEQSFSATTISATVSEGKTTWRVKGGQFEKFGVICYPEVLRAAQLELDPTQVYSLNGWTAYYAVKDDGKPQKVTRLVKAQA